jgi:hypothetical protein
MIDVDVGVHSQTIFSYSFISLYFPRMNRYLLSNEAPDGGCSCMEYGEEA